MQQGPYKHDPYNYDSYDAPNERSITDKIFGTKLGVKMRSPLFATVALIAVAGAFAAVIAGSYSHSKKDGGDVPVIQADAGDYKVAPETPGGMDVPYKDSTVFDTVRQAAKDDNGGKIENLLAQTDETAPAMTKEEAIGQTAAATPVPAPKVPAAVTPNSTTPTEVQAPEMDQSALEAPTPPATSPEKTAVTTSPANGKGASEIAIQQEIQKISPQELMKPQEAQHQAQANMQASTTPTAVPPRPETLHAAGDSPETLAFVRSVLQQKDAQAGQAATPAPVAAMPLQPVPAGIEPAAGATTSAAAAPGGYFVQVASVPSAAAAPGEWAKLQKTLVSLQGQSYRTQEASVSGKGTMFRIQAGPLPKDKATALCESIKAQKPGGCLVVH